MPLQTHEVFGLRTRFSEHSYIDRGNLDSEIKKISSRDGHIALKGESKSGKSWLRQKNFPTALVVQCRIEYETSAIYTEILRPLGITRVQVGELTRRELSFSAGVKGSSLLRSVAAKLGMEFRTEKETSFAFIAGGVDDISFISQLILHSGKRVVIEDFHYLREEARRSFAFDLKTLWDFGVYFIIVGIWRHSNYLLYLNQELAARVTEVSLYWSKEELVASLHKGAAALNCFVRDDHARRLSESSYGNIGIMQSLCLQYFLDAGVEEHQTTSLEIGGLDGVVNAGIEFASQLEAIYDNFADRVSKGIRKRRQSTKIYAHAMWTIFEIPDDELIAGVQSPKIYAISHAREPRIQLGNLRAVLRKFDQLQVDEQGRGLVLTFDESQDSIIVVDRGVLFYRAYRTRPWPWENLAQSDDDPEQYEIGFDAPDDE